MQCSFFKKWVLNDGTSLKLGMCETQIFETSVRKIPPSKLQHWFLSIKHWKFPGLHRSDYDHYHFLGCAATLSVAGYQWWQEYAASIYRAEDYSTHTYILRIILNKLFQHK